MVQRQLVKDHIRQSILDAAASLLISRGDSTIMAELADAAGVGRATLYRYFSSREELMSALASAAIDDASARLDAADLERRAGHRGACSNLSRHFGLRCQVRIHPHGA